MTSLELAAVDLGSNSFHLLVARIQGDTIERLENLRETVRLAAGLDAGRLLPETRERALECLDRFGQRLNGLAADHVRVVGTSALRRLRGRRDFLRTAEAALHHRVEIISGREEGRLVYRGVAPELPAELPRRLIIDIGGGSTELVLGEGAQPQRISSTPMGCVLWGQRYFPDGRISADRFAAARAAARLSLQAVRRRYRPDDWDIAVGSSGTVRGIWRVMRAQGWIEEEITRDGLERTVALLLETGDIRRIDYPDLRPDRRPTFPGGLAILGGLFDALGLERLRTTPRALRDGIVLELAARLQAGRATR